MQWKIECRVGQILLRKYSSKHGVIWGHAGMVLSRIQTIISKSDLQALQIGNAIVGL